MAIKRLSRPLPQECRRLLEECAELLPALDETVARGVAAGSDMQDAAELSAIFRERCRQLREVYYPDIAAIPAAPQ